MSAPTFDVERPTIKLVEKPTIPFSAAMIPFVDPTSVLPTKLGEWLTRGAGAADELSRLGIAPHNEYALPSFPYWEWTGQTDVQSSLKGTILLPVYEAWTLLWDSVTAPPVAYGDPLCTCVMGVGEPYAGYGALRQQSGVGYVVGFALNPIPSAAGQNLRFRANY